MDNPITILLTPEGKIVLFDRWRKLTNWKLYLTTDTQDYASFVESKLNDNIEVPATIYKYMNDIYLSFSINEVDFNRDSLRSIYIGATDDYSGEVFKTLIFIDYENSFKGKDLESNDNLIKTDKNIIYLGDDFGFLVDEEDILTKPTTNSLEQLIKYNDYEKYIINDTIIDPDTIM